MNNGKTSFDSLFDNVSFYLSKINQDSLADDVTYDKILKCYRYKDTGQFATREATINLQKKFLAQKEKELINYAARIKQGELGLYNDLTKTLKQIHVSNAIIQRGGLDKLSQSDLGTIGNILKKQYYAGRDEKTGKNYGLKYLLKDAPGLSEAQITQRLKLYAESGKLTALTLERQDAKSQGLMYAQRFLAAAEHCQDCIYYASLGRQLADFLPLPKTRCACRANCKCSIIYYSEAT